MDGGVSSSTVMADLFLNSVDDVARFDVDDTPMTFRTRPTRSRLLSTTTLHQRSLSHQIDTTPAMSRHLAMYTQQPSAVDQTAALSSPATDPSVADVKMSADITTGSSSSQLEKFRSQRSRSIELPSSPPAVKLESGECQPLKLATATAATCADVTASPLSPVKTMTSSVTAVLDSSTGLDELKTYAADTSQISPIARNNQTLVQHLKRASYCGEVRSDTVDVKKLRTSASTDGGQRQTPDVVVTSSHSLDRSSSMTTSSLSSSSVTLNPPSRQPLSVKTDDSNTSVSRSTVVTGDQVVPAKDNAISPRFVSYSSTMVIIIIVRERHLSLPVHLSFNPATQLHSATRPERMTFRVCHFPGVSFVPPSGIATESLKIHRVPDKKGSLYFSS